MARAKNWLKPWKEAAGNSALMVLMLFVVYWAGQLSPVPPQEFGIAPRTSWGLLGILFSPLLHAGPAHLWANALPLWILLTILFADRRYQAGTALVAIWLASGLGTWLIGRPGTVHIGASGVIYGLVVYLLAAGFWMKSWRAAFFALLVFMMYGGIFYGVLPRNTKVSWEGHLSGAIAGWWAARRQFRTKRGR